MDTAISMNLSEDSESEKESTPSPFDNLDNLSIEETVYLYIDTVYIKKD